MDSAATLKDLDLPLESSVQDDLKSEIDETDPAKFFLEMMNRRVEESGNGSQTNDQTNKIIFDAAGQGLLISFYVLIIILGFLFNAAIIWVIVGKF
jgi:hypothetical protein